MSIKEEKPCLKTFLENIYKVPFNNLDYNIEYGFRYKYKEDYYKTRILSFDLNNNNKIKK